jgi:hypothetical protein
MYRTKLKALEKWKQSLRRKPLIMRGARQVGKTWLLCEFGRLHYKQTVYVNFEDAVELRSLFNQDYDIGRIIETLRVYSHTPIDTDTLIIFDEIQIVPQGLTALKYFCENARQYHVAAAGSLLGMELHNGHSFPVGKVNFIDLHPMTFDEFLLALGEEELMEKLTQKDWDVLSAFTEKLRQYLKTYFYIGGMPEVVETYLQTRDMDMVRDVQKEIIRDYEADFSKYVPSNLMGRINMVWQSIPSQLAKENKKFVYGILREGGRAKDFETAIQWLLDCGLLTVCHRVKEPRLPLSAYQELSVFKLYLLDVGLLAAMSGLDPSTLLRGNELFTEFKGALTEQYVMQQLHAADLDYVGYWTNERSSAEVDFVIQTKGKVIPIEVKAEENLRSKSFKLFCEKFSPSMAIRTSMRPYKEEEWMTNVPLYAITHFE